MHAPLPVPIATMVSASLRACSRSLMNAPSPHLTSMTSALMPSAIFLLMMEESDQRNALDGARHIAQGVKNFVCRGHFGSLTDRRSRPGENLLEFG